MVSSLYTLLYGRPRRPAAAAELDLAKIKRILVVRDDHLGDLILSTPAFEALKNACPRAELTLVSSTYNAEAAEGNPYIDRILRYEKHKHSGRRWRLASAWPQYRFLRSLRQGNYDLAIGLRSQFNPRQARAVFASGAPYRLGHYPDVPKHRHLAFTYNIYVPETRDRKHEVERTLDVLKVIGINHPFPEPLVVLDQAARDFATGVLSAASIAGRPLIGYHISNRKAKKLWPPESFARLIELLRRAYPQAEHLITFAPGDQRRAGELRASLGSKVHTIATGGIKELGAIQENCQLFITLDGAPVHLAAALGVPTLVLYGASDPAVWHPWGAGHRWLKKGEAITAINAEEVFALAREMLEGKIATDD